MRTARSPQHIFLFLSLLLLVAVDAVAQESASDSAAVVSVIQSFRSALAGGDSLTALALLADDALIVEGGRVETREEYRSGHLRGDIGFAAAVTRDDGPIVVGVRGDVAWATSSNHTTGEIRGRTIDSRGVELMVLTRQRGQWKIQAVHWSSRSLQPGR